MTIAAEKKDGGAPCGARPTSSRQRTMQNLSGKAVADLLRNNGRGGAENEAPTTVHRVIPQKSNFSSPMDFYAGPQKAGKVTHGIRRYNNAENDSVGNMLTDEYLMSTDEFTKKQRGPKPVLSNACGVLIEEPPYRRCTKMNAAPAPMDAPYFEDNDPKPPRDAPAHVGRKHFKTAENEIFLAPGAKGSQEAPKFSKANTHNKTNKSHDILHLDRYTPEELQEHNVSHRHHGMPRYVAPEMPPPRKPTIRRVNVPAKQEHDVLGTGRFGKPEQVRPVCVARGSGRPKTQGLNLFVPPPQATQPKKGGARNDLLRYYDPAVDAPMEAPKVRRTAYRSNMETHEAPPRPQGKACGAYGKKNSATTCDLHYL